MFVIFLLVAVVVLYGWFVEPEWYRNLRYDVKVPASSKEISLILLTDIHVGRFSSSAHLKRLAKKASALAKNSTASAFLIGGDFVDYEAKYLGRILYFIEELSLTKIPIYGVLGNHDYMSFDDPTVLIAALRSAGCIVLRNEAVVIENALVLVGTDDLEVAPNYSPQLKYVPLSYFKTPVEQLGWLSSSDDICPELPRILLSHNPDGVYFPGTVPVVTLSGHTHGGQTIFIDVLARTLRRAFFWMLPQGTFSSRAGDCQGNGRRVLISRGLGGSAIPFRLGRRPELVQIRLCTTV